MKNIQIRQMGEIYKAATGFYDRTKRVAGSYFFPLNHLESVRAKATRMGFTIEVVENTGWGHRRSEITLPRPSHGDLPQGAIDPKRGTIKTLSDTFVIDCVTNRLIPEKNARFIGDHKGHPYWIDKNKSLLDSRWRWVSASVMCAPADRPRYFLMSFNDWRRLNEIKD